MAGEHPGGQSQLLMCWEFCWPGPLHGAVLLRRCGWQHQTVPDMNAVTSFGTDSRLVYMLPLDMT